MTSDTQKGVRAAYEHAVQQHLQKNLRTGGDWDRFNTIKRERDARLMTEQSAFKCDYTQRIADAKQIILREENSVGLDKPLPTWVDAHSDTEALQSKADTRVRTDHARREAVIQRDANDAYMALSADIRARDAPDLKQDFDQVIEPTRSGPKRL